jgi:hypothetical protein
MSGTAASFSQLPSVHRMNCDSFRLSLNRNQDNAQDFWRVIAIIHGAEQLELCVCSVHGKDELCQLAQLQIRRQWTVQGTVRLHLGIQTRGDNREDLDTANLDEIQRASDFGVLNGITTNPTLAAREGRSFRELILKASEIVKDGVVNAEIVSYALCPRAPSPVAKMPDSMPCPRPPRKITNEDAVVATVSCSQLRSNVAATKLSRGKRCRLSQRVTLTSFKSNASPRFAGNTRAESGNL